jgi:DNA-binding NarL/FixJ family response regulator
MVQVLSKIVGGSGAGFSSIIPSEKEYLRTILVVSPPGTISGALESAIEREFSWISVEYVPELHMACAAFKKKIQLILIDLRLASELEFYQAELARSHPSAVMAIMVDGDARVQERQLQTMDSRQIRGILPLNVNLDVLLSILRIMLKGGEYFPAAAFRMAGGASEGESAPERTPGDVARLSGKNQKQSGGEIVLELTGRELEILSRVAKGCQNKVIASDLGLSEHTVKIHIHNIITKLGVHNRTEAAILYLERAGNDGGANSDTRSGGTRDA